MKYLLYFVLWIMISLVFVSGYASGVFNAEDWSSPDENRITANMIYPHENQEYIDFWHKNKNQIARIFNPFMEQFNNSGCIDHIHLRALITTDGVVRRKAFELASVGADDVEVAYALHSFVFNEISYAPVDLEFDAVETMINKKGDCTEKSVLLLSLLKARGIEAYVIDGNAHRYVFVKLDGVWMPVDATAKDFYFVYKAWGNEKLRSPYVPVMQAFIFDEDNVLFNKDWCISA